MPTSKLKNVVYRALLPISAPNCERNPITSVTGHPVIHTTRLRNLYRKHHILGSATLLSSGDASSLILTSSLQPLHTASENTFFRVASITKTATALLTLRLSEEGVLDIDRPVREYFDAVPDSGLSGITLRHLLSHTSGLVDPPDLEDKLENGIPFTDFIGLQRMHCPGERFQYSNLGFGLIGCILEAVTGKAAGDLFRECLFRPLGMNATIEGCLLSTDMIMPVTRVLPYRKDSDLILTPLGSRPLAKPDPLRHYGHTAGSMYTDIRSLHTMMRVFHGADSSYISGRSVASMKTEHAVYGKISPTLSYGLGLLIISDRTLSGSMVYGHQGFAYGCADGAFFEESTGCEMITLNGGCSEARSGRLGLANRDFIRWAFRKELPAW